VMGGKIDNAFDVVPFLRELRLSSGDELRATGTD
jgi:hypothetical protein